MKYTIKFMNSFKKGHKIAKKQGKDLNKLYSIIFNYRIPCKW